MNKLIVIGVLAGFVPAGCGGKKDAAPKADPMATGSGGPAVTGEPPPAPPDPVQAAVAAATAEATALLAPAGADALRSSRTGMAIDALAAAVASVSREGWDPAAVVATVGKDRGALFKWVRDHTALVPYRGALRGVHGVLMDRVGNSLDRALLLAELLRQAGFEARLANAALEADAVAKLAATWSSRARPALPAGTVDDDALLAQVGTDLGVDAAAVKAAAGKIAAARQALVTRTRTRVEAQTAAIAKLVPPPDGAAAGADPGAFADHWWVQVQDGDVWSDLDPSLPDAAPGEPVGGAPVATPLADELPDELRHTLTIRVIGEVWRGGAREDAVLVEHTFAPAGFWGQRISLTNVAIDMPSTEDVVASADPAATLRSALAAQTEWFPMLRVGSTPVVHFSVSDGGELYDIMDPNGNTARLARVVQRATEAGVGGATDLLGTLPDDNSGVSVAPKPPLAEHSGFTAEWLELELRSPGAAPTTVRRVVFDALAPGTRDRTAVKPAKLSEAARLDRGLALVGETELLPLVARLPEALVVDRIAKALTEARPVVLEVLALAGKPMTKDLYDRLAQIVPPPGPLYGLALARFAWSSAADQVYLDGLNLLAQRRQMVAAGDRFRYRDGFDIMVNRVGVWPSVTDARAARIAQGVADTAVESALLQCKPGGDTCVRGVNTSDAFVAAGRDWTVVASESAPAIAALPGESRMSATADLAGGYLAIVPPQAASLATWWRVRPDTGEVLGMGVLGGSVSAETVSRECIMLNAGFAFCLGAFGRGGASPADTADAGRCMAGVAVAGVGMGVGSIAIELIGGMIAAPSGFPPS
jgi:hypothetical protein